MTIDIICPLYNAEKYIENQYNQIKNQSFYNNIKNINYIITESKDATISIVEKLQKEYEKIKYNVIKKQEFSHSLSREKIAKDSTADILVFITQDVKIEKADWLKKLTTPIMNNEVEATYSRQLCDNNTIEKYTRECNYPSQSVIKNKDDKKDTDGFPVASNVAVCADQYGAGDDNRAQCIVF